MLIFPFRDSESPARFISCFERITDIYSLLMVSDFGQAWISPCPYFGGQKYVSKESDKHQYPRNPLRPSPSKMLHDWATDNTSTEWRYYKQNRVDSYHLSKLMSEIHVFDASWTKSERTSGSKSLEIPRNQDTSISLTDCASKARYRGDESSENQNWPAADEVTRSHQDERSNSIDCKESVLNSEID